MATETLQPDGSVFALTNLTGASADVDEGVDSPGGDWLTLGDDGSDCILRASFPTPTGDPNTGAGLQKFRVYVRVGTEAGGNTPTLDLAIRETGGGSDLAVQTGISVTSYTGEVIEFTWDATVLGTADGSAVELYAIGQRSGGGPSLRRCVEFDAVEWVADYSAGAVDNPATDTAALGETSAPVADPTRIDTAALGETSTPAALADVTDTGALGETSSLLQDRTATDSGTLGEASSIEASVAKAGTDTGTLSESATVEAAIPVTDSGSLGDVSSVGVEIGTSDTGTLSEAASYAAVIAVADSATATETSTTAAAVSVDDAGSLAEAASLEAGGVERAGTDTATLNESAAVTVVISGTETFTLTESALFDDGATPFRRRDTQDTRPLDTRSAIGGTDSRRGPNSRPGRPRW